MRFKARDTYGGVKMRVYVCACITCGYAWVIAFGSYAVVANHWHGIFAALWRVGL